MPAEMSAETSAETNAATIIDVAVGVLLRHDGCVLLGDRPAGKPWAGWWELPGGKLEPGETVLQALTRELQEELGITLSAATPWVTYIHHYPTTTVRLHFCRVTDWQGQPQSLEQQQLKWIQPSEALTLPDLLPATYPPLRWLQLPDRYWISGVGSAAQWPDYLARLDAALNQGLRLVQWREPAWQASDPTAMLPSAFETVLKRCRAHGAKLLVNSVHPPQWWLAADGVHLRAQDAHALTARPETLEEKLLAVSTHNAQDLKIARELQADFAVLGPVLPTDSHPGEPTLGWSGFERLNLHAGLPIYALGGQTPATLTLAQSRGAHGIAGIRQLLG
jgi:8-oxo-dGTP diphosphatase